MDGLEVNVNMYGRAISDEDLKAGRRNGALVERYPKSPSVYRITCFRDGKENGPFFEFFPSGAIYARCAFVDGLKEGVAVSYFESGFVEEIGTYSRDKKAGRWEVFAETGDLLRVEIYSNGELAESWPVEPNQVRKPASQRTSVDSEAESKVPVSTAKE